VKALRAIFRAADWFPILMVPFAILALTRNFTQPLRLEAGLAILVGTILNLGLIGLNRFFRRQKEFQRQYPGFRRRKLHG
jgi:hypothetical protein